MGRRSKPSVTDYMPKIGGEDDEDDEADLTMDDVAATLFTGGRSQLTDGRSQLTDGRSQLTDGRASPSSPTSLTSDDSSTSLSSSDERPRDTRNTCRSPTSQQQPFDMISIFDKPGHYKRNYAAYLCCAPKDLTDFGLSFHRMLENYGFRIFLPPRDLVLTGPMYENMAKALEDRCNGKIIIVLSRNYMMSDECLFLTYFARVLDPDARCRNLIPVQIDKDIGEIPSVLKGMSIIRYNQAFRLGWLKQKLIDAISA
ncbi:Myeloid differentiation primary response protein MyD88 [Bulinus truncatus]|nr:Myeloid differentiation primary response protein MyD88 [Bulinus truncatus]